MLMTSPAFGEQPSAGEFGKEEDVDGDNAGSAYPQFWGIGDRRINPYLGDATDWMPRQTQFRSNKRGARRERASPDELAALGASDKLESQRLPFQLARIKDLNVLDALRATGDARPHQGERHD
jgi:hypothetical protein